MSPTEADLRAALRDGEGSGPNADQIIAGGRAARAQRRTRVLSTAATAVVVAAAGAGTAVVLDHSSGSDAASSSVTTNSGSAADVGASGGRVAVVGPAAGAAPGTDETVTGVAIPCPSSLPQLALPGGGSPGQFGSTGPLFNKPVTYLVVCAYGSPGQTHVVPAQLVLAGTQAARLAASLEQAPTTPSARPCPTTAASHRQQLAIIGVTSRGAKVSTATTTLTGSGCGTQVTNGTATRFAWTPPADLQQILMALTPGTGKLSPSGSGHPPSGTMHGSPIQS